MNLKDELHDLFKRVIMGRMDAVERLVELIHPAVQHHADQAAAAAVGGTAYQVGGAPVAAPVPADPATHSLPLGPGAIEPGTVTSATPAVVAEPSEAKD
ncbi:hypothetical protein [Variovorax sp. PBL-E5]|uniref:hypothetical protein n=1 Tax=Variovorax sp. PBL-E5 TaxID=434014 RepID=UPI0013198777|nr:hypothetical protein [Variovorax sp. PBL-E5]VTU37065.1 hypothetical protein E5CHR_04475 [Variovorax sp. PBL-E5]